MTDLVSSLYNYGGMSMSSWRLQEQIEALGGRDAATADGYVVCTDESGRGRIMASAVPHRVRVRQLSLFHRGFSACVAMRPGEVVFGVMDYRPKSACVITFEASEKEFVPLFTSFLLYLGQTQLLHNPIICCKFNHRH